MPVQTFGSGACFPSFGFVTYTDNLPHLDMLLRWQPETVVPACFTTAALSGSFLSVPCKLWNCFLLSMPHYFKYVKSSGFTSTEIFENVGFFTLSTGLRSSSDGNAWISFLIIKPFYLFFACKGNSTKFTGTLTVAAISETCLARSLQTAEKLCFVPSHRSITDRERAPSWRKRLAEPRWPHQSSMSSVLRFWTLIFF